MLNFFNVKINFIRYVSHIFKEEEVDEVSEDSGLETDHSKPKGFVTKAPEDGIAWRL